MIFSSLEFIFVFLPIFLIVYYICPIQARSFCILAFGLIFYALGVKENPWYLLLFTASLIVNFYLGLQLKKRKNSFLLGIGVFYNLAILLCFKLDGNYVFPLGLSFYTFQNISYLVDVYYRANAEKSLLSYGAYIVMFPQLISGPLVRYQEIKPQLSRKKRPLNILYGLETFLWGLGFKVLLANRLGGLWKNVNTIGYESISTPLAWLGIIAFSLQLYFDFWGYSLMARGLGKMMGFELPDNFNHPYTALTMTDFWRCWHISLGNWFREYVYIPLGGNRRRKYRMYFNLLVVWLLTGFWHGKGFNFILWGLFSYALIVSEKEGLGKFWNRFPLFARIYMFLAVTISWLLFATDSLPAFTVYLGRLFGRGGEAVYAGDFMKNLTLYGGYLAAGILLATRFPSMIYDKIKTRKWLLAPLLIVIFVWSVYEIYMGQNDPFLYFQF